MKCLSQSCLVSKLCLLLCCCGTSLFADEKNSDQPAKDKITKSTKPGAWQVLYLATNRQGVEQLKESSPLSSIKELDLTGASVGDAYQFGKFFINGSMGIKNGLLTRTEGANAAVKLAEIENFELEGKIDASGIGGFFMLLGFKEGHGYLLSNFTYKKSGSPWYMTELRGSKALPDSHHEFNRWEWKGVQAFKMSVKSAELNIVIGNTKIATELPLSRYHAGSLILGTYDTHYGPRELKVHSLRVRTLPAD